MGKPVKRDHDIRVCPVCGKTYLPAYKHIYKIYIGNGMYRPCCSWSCQRKHEKEHGDETYRR